MTNEGRLAQRDLVGRRLYLPDADLSTKYLFPFVDATWSVPFCVVDLLGQSPQVVSGPMSRRAQGFASDAKAGDLVPVESVPLDRFRELVHFDPWWVFRGISGVPRAWVTEIIGSNIAGVFTLDGRSFKVHDLAFTADLRALTSLVANDDVFHRKDFHRNDIELFGLARRRRSGTPG